MQESLRSPIARRQGIRVGDCLEIRRTKNRGWGLFATEDIPAGTVVLREEPLACIRTMNLTFPSESELSRQFAEVAPLGNSEKTVYESLADLLVRRGVNRDWLRPFPSRAGKRITVRDLAILVAEANGFALTTAMTGVSYLFGLYDAASLLNHSCEPNALRFGTGKVTTESLVRTRLAVPAGQEVTVSYLVGLEEVPHRGIRQAATDIHSKFVCRCARCDREAKDAAPKRNAVPPVVIALMKQAKVAQMGCRMEDAWVRYWRILTEFAEGARLLTAGNRLTLLLGASCSGLGTPQPDPVAIGVVLRKLLGMCREGGHTHVVTQARQFLLQAATNKDVPEVFALWQLCLQRLREEYGPDLRMDMDTLTCPAVWKIVSAVKHLSVFE